METEPVTPYNTPRPSIGIVGAGISGLRCADVLLENGFQVTILEARDRIGGRVSRIPVDFMIMKLNNVTDPYK